MTVMKKIDASAYNAILKKGKMLNKFNSLAFAFGLTDPSKDYDLAAEASDGTEIPVTEAFEKAAESFNIRVKKVSNINEAKDKTAFLVYGWYTSEDSGEVFAHIVRKNTNGTFEQKYSYNDYASAHKSLLDASYESPVEEPWEIAGIYILDEEAEEV